MFEVFFDGQNWTFLAKAVAVSFTAVTFDALLSKVSHEYMWAKQSVKDAVVKAFDSALNRTD